MKRFLTLVFLAALAANAYAVEPSKEILLDQPISDDASKHGVTLLITWPEGAVAPDHTHPGDEYAMVLDGAIEITTKDKGAKIYRVGEAYHNAKGIVHSARAMDGKPAKTLATLIVENGKPLSQKVE